MLDQARRVRAGQHVLHHDARCTRSWPAARSSTSSSTRRTIRRAEHPFKGNVDLGKLDALIAARRRRRRSPTSASPATVNMAGGQPISMANLRGRARALRAARDPAHPRRDARGRERLVHPAARAGLRGQDASPRSSTRSARYTDGGTMCAQEGPLVNIGGWLALNDDDALRGGAQPRRGLRRAAHLRRPRRARHGGDGDRHRGVGARSDHIRARIGQVAVPRRAAR